MLFSELSSIMLSLFSKSRHESVNLLLSIISSFRAYHTGKCLRRFGGIYAFCRYFIDRKW